MDAESEYENKRARDAIQTIETIQSMIDVSADRLEGLRTQCSTSAELTQQEIRTLEGKLVKHFSRQLVIKASLGDEMKRQLRDVPCLAQWLRVVGLSPESIEAVCSRVPSLETLRERSDHEMRALLAASRDEEVLRLQRAMHRLRTYIEALARGESGEGSELQLFWDSWERHARASPRSRPKPNRHNDDHANTNHKKGVVAGAGGAGGGVRSPSSGAGGSRLAAGAPLVKSRSHESQLSRPDASDLSDNSQSSAVNTAEGTTPPASPREPEPDNTPTHTHPPTNYYNNNVWYGMPGGGGGGGGGGCGGAGVPRSPRTPRTPVTRCMAHDIAHRFTKTFNMIATCDYCDKQMLFGSGLKCKECKFKCHRDCESKVPPSCGLPPEFVAAFKDKFHKDGGYYGCVSPVSARGSASAGSGAGGGGGAGAGAAGGFLAAFTHRPRRRHHAPLHNTLTNNGVGGGGAHGPDSSSNTSSCNSSTPSSPALCAPAPAHPAHHPAHPSHLTHKQQFQFPEIRPAVSSPNHTGSIQSPARSHHENKEDLVNSLNSDSRRNVAEARARENQDARWPRQNSLSMKEWDIPYDELKLFEVIGTGRFGTVYRGSWHGAVAVKLLHVSSLADDCVPLDTFKHEVATFRKTRHENLVLFMGACMKPPRLAIVTSLCKGMTLYTHIHLRKDKFTANKSVIVAQQISQGMGYLHARGIVHKDLKTKNIFLENGKVVITDFGLFSVTKLCFGNKELGSGSRLGLPGGWLCYLAPELIRALTPHASLHLPFSKATDVYAFGTVWYELLLGEYPFKGQPPESIIWQVGKGVKQSLANMQASRDIKDILMACWAFRAADRPDFPRLLTTLQKLPRKRLARSPSHPVHLSRSADSVF